MCDLVGTCIGSICVFSNLLFPFLSRPYILVLICLVIAYILEIIPPWHQNCDTVNSVYVESCGTEEIAST